MIKNEQPLSKDVQEQLNDLVLYSILIPFGEAFEVPNTVPEPEAGAPEAMWNQYDDDVDEAGFQYRKQLAQYVIDKLKEQYDLV